MHQVKPDIEALSQAIVAYAMDRLRMDPPTLDHPLPQETLEAMAGQTITEEGLGGEDALRLFIETLAPLVFRKTTPAIWHLSPPHPRKCQRFLTSW